METLFLMDRSAERNNAARLRVDPFTLRHPANNALRRSDGNPALRFGADHSAKSWDQGVDIPTVRLSFRLRTGKVGRHAWEWKRE